VRGAAGRSTLHIGLYSPALPSSNSANGIVTYTRVMRHALQELGHRVTVLDTAEVQRPDGSVELLPLPSPFRARLDRWTERLNPDLWMPHINARLARSVQMLHRADPFDIFEMEESFGFAGGLGVPIPIVMRLHGPHFLGKDAVEPPGLVRRSNQRMALEGRAIRTAEAITSPSARLLAATLDHYEARSVRAVTIPNPIAAEPAERRWSIDRCDVDQILCVGRFDLRKGADVALAAFALVAERNPRAKLTVVGPDVGLLQPDGHLIHFAEYLATRVPPALHARINYLGAVPPADVAALRVASALCLTCSRFENFPYSVAEAMAAGVPSIVSDSFGNAELIEDGKSGFVVPIGDVAATADAIERALVDRGRLAAMGEAAYRRCAEWLAPDRVAADTVDFYRTVIAARGA